MEESNDNIKKTILVAEDVESNFLLLKALLGKTYNLLLYPYLCSCLLRQSCRRG